MSTKDGFECSFDADFNKNVNIDGKLTLTGGLSSALSIANGGTGATTADGISKSHYHTYISDAADGGQSSGYLRIVRMVINGTYLNQGIEIDFIRRGDQFVTTLAIQFNNQDNTDPSLYAFNSIGSTTAWMHRASASTWDVYIQKSGWDSVSVLNVRKGANTNGINLTTTNVYASSLPSGAIQATTADFVVEQGVSSGWNYTKWNSGKSEAWRTIELGDVPLTSSLAGGVYSNASYNGRGVTLPTGLFTAIPLAFANVYSNGYTHCQVASANTTQLVYRLWSPYSATVSGVIVSLYVVGKWK
jgi:hypothetical protein